MMTTQRRYAHVDQMTPALDAQDVETILSLLTDDCYFQAGNTPAVTGKEVIGRVFRDFFPRLKQVQHEIRDIFESEDRAVYCGYVTYTRPDDTELRVPVCDVFELVDNKIRAYYIYIDWSAL